MRIRKEADKVRTPDFPTIGELKGWRVHVAEALVEASGYGDQAEVSWFNAAFHKDATFEMMADSGGTRFMALDQKLGAALHRDLEKAARNRPNLGELH